MKFVTDYEAEELTHVMSALLLYMHSVTFHLQRDKQSLFSRLQMNWVERPKVNNTLHDKVNPARRGVSNQQYDLWQSLQS
jgi:hypothetical protein